MLYNMRFFLENLQGIQKSVPLHCVFHSIRFKVNKGWSTAVLLFLCLYPYCSSVVIVLIAFLTQGYVRILLSAVISVRISLSLLYAWPVFNLYEL